MNLKTAKETLLMSLPSGLSSLLVGAPGIGKTALVKQAARELGLDLVVSMPAISDPTDFKGLPIILDGKAEFQPVAELRTLVEATAPTLWFIDDLGQASMAVQAAIMQLVHSQDRQLGQHSLPSCVTVVAATNRPKDGAGVRGLINPLKSRFQLILDIEPDPQAWEEWAMSNRVDPLVIGYLRYYMDFPEPAGGSRFFRDASLTSLTQSPCPRTWEHVSRVMRLPGFFRPDSFALRQDLLTAAIGPEIATEFLAFIELSAALTPFHELLANPSGVPIPKDLGMLYVLVASCASKTDTTNVSTVCEFITRLAEEYQVLYRHFLQVADNSAVQSLPVNRLTVNVQSALV